MLMDYQNYAGSLLWNFVGKWFVALQSKTMHYFLIYITGNVNLWVRETHIITNINPIWTMMTPQDVKSYDDISQYHSHTSFTLVYNCKYSSLTSMTVFDVVEMEIASLKLVTTTLVTERYFPTKDLSASSLQRETLIVFVSSFRDTLFTQTSTPFTLTVLVMSSYIK